MRGISRTIESRPAAHGEVAGIWIVRPFAQGAQALSLGQLYVERARKARHKLCLQLTKLASVPLQAIRPDLRARVGSDQLGIQQDPLINAPYAALKNVAHAQVAADLPHIGGF